MFRLRHAPVCSIERPQACLHQVAVAQGGALLVTNHAPLVNLAQGSQAGPEARRHGKLGNRALQPSALHCLSVAVQPAIAGQPASILQQGSTGL